MAESMYVINESCILILNIPYLQKVNKEKVGYLYCMGNIYIYIKSIFWLNWTNEQGQWCLEKNYIKQHSRERSLCIKSVSYLWIKASLEQKKH